MERIIKGLKSFFNKIYTNEYIRVFGIVFILGFIFFGTTALGNGLTMSFGGDYELQTMAFYSDGYTKIWNFLKTGEFPMYDFSNAFGHDYLAGASFYYLSSPLFYLLLLVPQKFLFQGIYILMLIKYAIGGTLFYVLLKKFYNYKNRTCLIGAIAYAFCGWNLYNLWFHFSDAMALFPLLLIGIERCLKDKKGGLISLSLFLLALANYFMFVPFAIFGVFYFFFRWIKIYGVTKKSGYTFWERWNVALRGALCYISGGLLAGFILIPNLIFSQTSGRVDYDGGLLTQFLSFFATYENIDGEMVRTGFKSLGEIFNKDNLKGLYDYMFKWPENSLSWGAIDAKKIKLVIVANFLFMNSNCLNNTVFYTGSLDNMLGATFISTPLILLFIPTVINTFKSKNKWDIFTLIFCCIIPFIPFTYYLLHGFSKEYGRWELILVVLMLIYVLKTFDKIEYINRWMFSVAIIVNVILAGYCVYYSYTVGQIDMEYRILIIVGQLVYMFVVYHLSFVYHERKWFKDLATGGIILELFVTTVITVNMHGVTNYETLYDGSEVFNEERQVIKDIQELDDGFYRIHNVQATRNYINLPSALSYNGTSSFNTIYNRYNLDFVDRSTMLYSGSMGDGALNVAYHEKRPYFDEFVGIKYYVIDKNHLNSDDSYMSDYYDGRSSSNPTVKQEYTVNVPYGYEKLENEYEYFEVYENKESIELGFAYENYITSSNAGKAKDPTYYETMYSNMAIVDDVNKELYKDDYQEKVGNNLMLFNEKNTWSINNLYSRLSTHDLKKEITMREDFSEDQKTRTTFEVSNHSELVNILMSEQYGKYGQIMHGRWQDMHMFGDEITLTPLRENKKIAPNATKENPANVIVEMKMGPQCMISLYGENDKLLTQDCHQYHHYSMGGYSENKYERSFYITEEVKKVVIEFISDAKVADPYYYGDFNLNNINITYSYFDRFKEDWSFAKEHQLENVQHSVNGFKFDTNYDKSKIVCLNVPYGEGWKLMMDDKELDMIALNGGFIGFFAPYGEHSYSLDYSTPYIDQGIKLTIGGIGIGLLTFVGYNFNYCLLVSKSTVLSTRFFKKKEDDEKPNGDNPNEVNEEVETIEIDEKEVKVKKYTKITSLVLISLFAIIINLLIMSIFKFDLEIINFIGLVLAYALSSVMAYFASWFFRYLEINKESIIKYLKISGVGLGIEIIIYLILTILKIYLKFKYLVCSLLVVPILYLVYQKILKKYL